MRSKETHISLKKNKNKEKRKRRIVTDRILKNILSISQNKRDNEIKKTSKIT
jgi:hypothetical protein